MPESRRGRDIPVKIYSLASTPSDAIVFLEEADGTRLLPIWIGPVEGQAIAIKFSGLTIPRPFTHDLLVSIVTAVGYKFEKVVIDRLEDHTYYAKLHLRSGEKTVVIDSRPSDAMAVAVRVACDIFVSEQVFNDSQILSKPITEDELKDFKDKLKDLKPGDIIGSQTVEGGDAPSIEEDK